MLDGGGLRLAAECRSPAPPRR